MIFPYVSCSQPFGPKDHMRGLVPHCTPDRVLEPRTALPCPACWDWALRDWHQPLSLPWCQDWALGTQFCPLLPSACHDWVSGPSITPTWLCMLGLGARSSVQGLGLTMRTDIWQQENSVTGLLPHNFRSLRSHMTWCHGLEVEHPCLITFYLLR